MDAKLVISAIAVVIAVALAVMRRRLTRQSGAMASGLVLIFMLLTIWLSRGWRDAITVLAVLLVGLISWPIAVTVTTAAIVGILSLVIPGGSSVIVLALVGVISIAIAFDFVRLVERLDRARKLAPGERPSGDVVLTGRAKAQGDVPMPLDAIGKCAWYRLTMGSTIEMSTAPIEIRTAAGSAIVEPKDVSFEIVRGAKTLTPEERTRVLGRAPTPAEEKASPMLEWIPDDGELFVIGAPSWEPSTRAEVSYREAPMIPVFRAAESRKVLVEDRDGAVVRADKLWALAAWLVWGALGATIATMQLAGVL